MRFVNLSERDLDFEIDGHRLVVPVGEACHIPDRIAYVVELQKIQLTRGDVADAKRVQLATSRDESAEEARLAAERAAAAKAEAEAKAKVAADAREAEAVLKAKAEADAKELAQLEAMMAEDAAKAEARARAEAKAAEEIKADGTPKKAKGK